MEPEEDVWCTRAAVSSRRPQRADGAGCGAPDSALTERQGDPGTHQSPRRSGDAKAERGETPGHWRRCCGVGSATGFEVGTLLPPAALDCGGIEMVNGATGKARILWRTNPGAPRGSVVPAGPVGAILCDEERGPALTLGLALGNGHSRTRLVPPGCTWHKIICHYIAARGTGR
ncbi:hypothetical protein NDU88_003595 [Pleurodeles waltl]|uniref:Uncharacterized protein n=1 Tax=Pleurodeles waltl TaxID=8319 RepID=A0AAV7VEM0_PLEWA|nr:hypothetical protein NDU88_003595 [Pleurodeles waltl]